MQLARAYDPARRGQGRRVLVDRLWPRGVKKTELRLDEWLREVAPSTELRRWYGHQPERFPEFRRRYRTELRDAEHRAALAHLRELAAAGRLTLVTATKEVDASAAAVLRELL